MDEAGKTAKEMKRSVAQELGLSIFQQRLLLDGSELPDDAVVSENVQLILMEFQKPELEEDERIFAAAMVDDSEALEELLRRPRNPNVRDVDGTTPLHHTARYGHVECMALLLDAGAHRDLPDRRRGFTPLLFAAANGHADAVRLLLEAKADGTRAENGATPVSVATQAGHVEVVRLLIEGAEADPLDGCELVEA